MFIDQALSFGVSTNNIYSTNEFLLQITEVCLLKPIRGGCRADIVLFTMCVRNNKQVILDFDPNAHNTIWELLSIKR